MHSIDLPPNRRIEKPSPASLGRSIVTGAIGFCLTSLIVFSTVAFAQRWMYHHLGITGAYLLWIALFVLLGGLALSMKSMPAVSAVLFVGNLLGYFVGSFIFYRLTDKAGLLVWGIIYGIFVGGGLGAALYLLQSRQLAGDGAH